MSNYRTSRPAKPKHPKEKRGRTLKTFELTNIEKPITHKPKAMSSRAVVHKKRGTHKTPHPKKSKTVKFVSTPETRSIEHAKVALYRAARPPKRHKHVRKVRTSKLTNIEKAPVKTNKGPKEPKISKKGWYS